jgi:hypothetical protein
MTIQTIGTIGAAAPQAQNANASAASNSVEQTLLDFMKESPGQRMIDEWLKAHHLTEQELQKMPAQQREAIEKQMAQDIENAVKQKAETNLKNSLAVIG